MSTYPSPKVSVCVVTYNQEKYIGQCLQSLVDQETDFPYEVIVSDDCSTDGTSRIVMDFAQRFPGIIRPIIHSKNIGASRNFRFVHERASGEYISHVDGDDYVLPGKLQRQSDFLDRNPGISIVWHRVYALHDVRMVPDRIPPPLQFPRKTFNRAALLRFGTVGINSTKMYRKIARPVLADDFPVIDFSVNVESMFGGDAAILDGEPLGVYRCGIGISSAGGATKRLYAKSLRYFLTKYPNFRRDIGAHVLLSVLAAVKNQRWKDLPIYRSLLLSTFSLGAARLLMKEWQTYRAFKLPR